MKRQIVAFSLLSLLISGAQAQQTRPTAPQAKPAAQPQAAGRQNVAALRGVVEQYLQTQSAGMPGEVGVKVGAVDQRLSLAACPAPEAFQQPGARPWGKTTVGVRCSAPFWTI